MNYKLGLEQSGIVYPDGWATGFPLWTDKGWEFQNKTLENLVQQFESDFDIMVHYPNATAKLDEYCNMYDSRMEHYDNSFPTYYDGGNNMLIITDSLPYNLIKMKEKGISAMLTYYYVVRLLKAKKIPMYRDYYISPLLQLNLCIDDMDKEYAIRYVMKRCQTFLKNIGLPAVVLEYDGVPGYSEKVYMFASCNAKGDMSTILQCSLLDDKLLSSFNVSDYFKNKYVFDLGYSQKLFAFIADNNMDNYGIRWPSFYGQKDVALVFKNLDVLQRQELSDIAEQTKIILDDRLGNKKLRSIKNEYVKQGVRYIFVQREYSGKKFFTWYGKGEKKEVSFEQMCKIIAMAKTQLDDFYYSISERKMNSVVSSGYGYVSEFSYPGKVINFL